ncbi:ABC-type dipeptide/oligopeptide/nickel transport system ATPase component [Georgenia soli]|uniref:ABC-type dipeptide/oligopeptide/nickel transport system ATPase component n=1 Tax=Georgenia soli TaxID=638953 RepID=A0A2A9EN25_9MICO|nr:ABC transporter ATP-binding protein [Georgenia soli]PFG40487.1 ABC-type dipeptide/oligopeptide/nickel transport system ATPase component [Georgenia soli]
MNDGAPVLAVDRLTVEADGGQRLVDDVSFTLHPGERLGVIGESGSGKSLTSLAVAGLLAPGLTARGSVRLAGTEVVGAPEATLNRVRGSAVALVFQEPLTALDPLMRVGRQIGGPLRRHRGLRGAALRAAVLDLMAEVSLPEPERLARSFPHEMSGGQRQRVAIAMALACDPTVLITDEPTTALDVTVQAEILELLLRVVRERGTALVFVSHDMAVVSQVVQRVIVMRSGAVVEEGDVAELVAAPRHPYTQRLVESARTLDATLGGRPPAAGRDATAVEHR